MGRKSKAQLAAEAAAAEASSVPETPAVTTPRRRRRRRSSLANTDTSSETSTLIGAVLRSRGPQGATPEILSSVITWALRIREEGEEIRAAQGRIRRKPLVPSEKLAYYEMNRALLDGVLEGTLTVKVQDDGQLLFVHSSLAETAVFSVNAIDSIDSVSLEEGTEAEG